MKATMTEEYVLHTECLRCGNPEKVSISGKEPGTVIEPWRCGRCGGGIAGRIGEDGAAEVEAAAPEGKSMLRSAIAPWITPKMNIA